MCTQRQKGHPQRNNSDWFHDLDQEIQVLLDEKRKLHLRHLQENSESSKIALAAVKAKVQMEIRQLKDNWWREQALNLQRMADNHDYHGLFNGLKAIYGPRSNMVAPVRSADESSAIQTSTSSSIRSPW